MPTTTQKKTETSFTHRSPQGEDGEGAAEGGMDGWRPPSLRPSPTPRGSLGAARRGAKCRRASPRPAGLPPTCAGVIPAHSLPRPLLIPDGSCTAPAGTYPAAEKPRAEVRGGEEAGAGREPSPRLRPSRPSAVRRRLPAGQVLRTCAGLVDRGKALGSR